MAAHRVMASSSPRHSDLEDLLSPETRRFHPSRLIDSLLRQLPGAKVVRLKLSCICGVYLS